MLGWIIVAVVIGLAIWLIVVDARGGESMNSGLGKFFGVVVIIGMCIYSTVHYYMYRVEPVPRLKAYGRTIAQTKNLVKDRDINLQDMEVTKTLSGMIKERNEYIARLEVAKRSPFCLFKPTIELD